MRFAHFAFCCPLSGDKEWKNYCIPFLVRDSARGRRKHGNIILINSINSLVCCISTCFMMRSVSSRYFKHSNAIFAISSLNLFTPFVLFALFLSKKVFIYSGSLESIVAATYRTASRFNIYRCSTPRTNCSFFRIFW